MARKPQDLDHGLQRYGAFHQLEPEQIGQFAPGLQIPRHIYYVGEALWVTYRSDKWYGNKSYNYIHEHNHGVGCYRPDAVCDGARVAVPVAIRSVQTLVRLGDCLGFAYRDQDSGSTEAKVKHPYPELYCTPDGHALLVIAGKSKLFAMCWGGNLGVFARGIVG